VRSCYWQNGLRISSRSVAEHFVLKPQREGGGNNFYGSDIPAKLKGMSDVEKEAYVLMQRIFPPPQKGLLVRAAAAHMKETVSELGIFSTFLGDVSCHLRPRIHNLLSLRVPAIYLLHFTTMLGRKRIAERGSWTYATHQAKRGR